MKGPSTVLRPHSLDEYIAGLATAITARTRTLAAMEAAHVAAVLPIEVELGNLKVARDHMVAVRTELLAAGCPSEPSSPSSPSEAAPAAEPTSAS